MAYAIQVVRQIVAPVPMAAEILLSTMTTLAAAAGRVVAYRQQSCRRRISVSRLSAEWLLAHEIASGKHPDES